MAVSVNGMIAKSNDDTSWLSSTEWDSYSLAVRNAGCLIIGRRTYEILTKQPEFSEFQDVKVVVVSQTDVQLLSQNHFRANSPKSALSLVAEFEQVIVAGGGKLDAAFMEEKLIDEIYLDIEPIAIGQGISVFEGKNFDCKLKFLGQKMISENVVQLHYEVLK
ncbi:MAG: Bifunctional deaminase-reductase domain protein [Parcubacteria group bacterium GW2011_GWE2_38_18]|nr:MAG: Bifunctional deaminase-reductase domain protein [Parcubacteria group bacterium GW2011_GWE2_38_18]